MKSAFGPITKELEDVSEVDQLEEDLEEVEKIIKSSKENEPIPNPFTVDEVEQKSVCP